MPTLGQIIKMYREENNMSMDDFSKKSGLSKSYISVLEKNKRPGSNKPVVPSNTVIEQVAKAINVPIESLWSAVYFDDIIEAVSKIEDDPLSFIDEEDKEFIQDFLLPQSASKATSSSHSRNRLAAGIFEKVTKLNEENLQKVDEYIDLLLMRQNKEEKI